MPTRRDLVLGDSENEISLSWLQTNVSSKNKNGIIRIVFKTQNTHAERVEDVFLAVLAQRLSRHFFQNLSCPVDVDAIEPRRSRLYFKALRHQ
jgi:hypothetical protein